MRFIPVDVSKLQFLVVGPPTPNMRDGVQATDRDTGKLLWNLSVTVIGGNRAETIEITLPEGGFPKELGIGTFVIPEGLSVITWDKPKDGRHGMFVKADAVKVVGGVAGVKVAAA